jgi:SprT protein
MTIDQIEIKMLEKIEESFVKAESYFGKKFDRPVDIHFRQKGQCAGTASWIYSTSECKLKFNRYFMESETEDMINQTVPHEVAHLIAYLHYGRYAKAHGREWKSVMRNVMGLNPERCHSYSMENAPNRGQRFDYTCGCMTHNVSKIKHNKMQRGQTRTCRTCKGNLKLI